MKKTIFFLMLLICGSLSAQEHHDWEDQQVVGINKLDYHATLTLPSERGRHAEWFSLDEVPSLAFDHDLILRMALKELRKQIHFEPIGFELLPEKFTIKELQLLYEAILDVKFDRRNFYNKMRHLEILTQLDERVFNSPKKEAFLFKFNPRKYYEL